MKKIAILILMAFSYQVNAGTIVVDSGSYRYKSDHWDKKSGNYRSLNSSTYRSYQIEQTKVRSAITGAMSAGTIKTEVTADVNKRQVTNAILQKARIAGKALGKGAAKLGGLAARRHPLGIAFNLALGALAGSPYFWDDEQGDFVKKQDQKHYFLFKTNEANSVNDMGMTRKQFDDWCSGTVTIDASYDANKHGKASRWCSEVSIETKITSEKLVNKCGVEKASLNAHNACVSGNTLTGFAVKAIPIIDNIPITEDEFFDESEPEADDEPNKWVETSGVQPSDEPTATVPAGTVAQTNPYTDPEDGKTKQTRWDFEPDGKVRETVIERPDLTPDSPEAPRLEPPAQDETGTGIGDKDKPKDGDDDTGKDKEQQEQSPDLCEQHPDILACDKQPQIPEEQEFDLPSEKQNLFFAPETMFPSTGRCPAPVSFTLDIPLSGSRTFAFDTMPICEIAVRLRNLVIAMAWLIVSAFCLYSFSRAK